MIVLLSVRHFLRLWDLLSSYFWKDLLLTRLIYGKLVLLLCAHPIKTMWASHWNSLDGLLSTCTWSAVTLSRLIHLADALAI